MRLRQIFAACILTAGLCASPALAQYDTVDIGKLPARQTPEWLKTGVIYQIWPRAFTAAGTLNGVTDHLDDVQALNANILLLLPIHPSSKLKAKGTLGSPYAIHDYYAIDPALGTEADFHRLVDEAHKKHMYVLMDMVFNHTGWDSVMMSHADWYRKGADGNIRSPYDWTDVAALNYDNPELRAYMTKVLLHWRKDFGVDGFRCDAAGEVPTSYWESARATLDKEAPGTVMIAEANKPELLKVAFDSDYSWPLMKTINEVFMNGAPASSVEQTMESQAAIFPIDAMHMRMVDDHDELRAATRYGFPGAVAAWTVVATLNGTPLIFDGEEVGDSTQSGAPALFENQKIFWPSGDFHPTYKPYFTAIDQMRRHNAALQQGATEWVHNVDEKHVVTYLRHSGTDEFLIAVNLSDTPYRGGVEVSSTGWHEMALPGFKNPQDALPIVSLDAFGVRIFERTITAPSSAAGTH